jgi:hypothetical protein
VFGQVGPYGGDRDVHVFQHPLGRYAQRADAALGHPRVPHGVALGLVAHLVS